ncbi:hypothetical protein [Cupriavidus sp. U2]|uniref:hypothetical protein n=1 Tax=Cupriavidus sp. U2 TaxID=2920269 RepID=UPI00129D8ACB|nr:hypothetical protein [Cupriavidus sp. U2]
MPGCAVAGGVVFWRQYGLSEPGFGMLQDADAARSACHENNKKTLKKSGRLPIMAANDKNQREGPA